MHLRGREKELPLSFVNCRSMISFLFLLIVVMTGDAYEDVDVN